MSHSSNPLKVRSGKSFVRACALASRWMVAKAPLHEYLYEFCQYSRRQRIVLRNRTERLSELLDWKNLASYYRRARLTALHKHAPHLFSIAPGAIHNGDSVSERSFCLSRPYSAPASPSASGRSTPLPSLGANGSGCSTPTSHLEEDEVDEVTERLELGLSTATVGDGILA
ncbi:Glycogen [starch] synthase [Paragonimus heterotremus]|uniref:Glycogen [starch] synthase n=1 Tax=Paragonimus heterotremus TaxID=100268 RepID=A0A8J4WEX6_9TREM|nr:Glycogen [starch] synthase [Paragonimus heterotremus]